MSGRADLLALLENRTIFDLNVKEVDLLVILSDGAFIVNPDQRVFEPVTRSHFMNADVDMYALLSGIIF